MCIITGLIAIGTAIGSAVSAVAGAVGTAVSAIGGFLGTSLGTIGGATITSGAAAGTVVGGTSITVGGVLAGVGAATMAATSLGMMYHNARASASMQQAQIDAMKQLQSEDAGKLEVNNTARTIQENSRFKRTLTSLRVPLGITPKQNTEQIIQNVYGVDSNTVATATQNMMGLNIATA
jgi:hypothetical protein